MGRRRQARECALQVLYLTDTSGMSAEEAMLTVKAGLDLDEATADFARELAFGAAGHRKTLDTRIGKLARNWSLERMASVDRSLLRLAAYELLHGAAPRGVVIDEALEISKTFSSADSSRFLNGILDKIPSKKNAEKSPPKKRTKKK